MNRGDGTLAQAVAARRAGASWDDLNHPVALGLLLFGLPAADLDQELIAALAEWKQQGRIEGTVVARSS